MKEIKFRGWHEESKTMYEHIWIAPDGGWQNNMTSFAYFGSKNTLMQYTGLKDKNGKEIYEGDIVKTSGMFSHSFVVCDRFAYFVELPRTGTNKYHQFIDASGQAHEVVGNVYENPELLK